MGPSYEAAHAAIAGRLSAAALHHCERVAVSAADLALRHGLDAGEARLAGLLHDWDREVPGEDLLVRARRLGVPVTEVDEAVPYLLHGPVAAAELALEMPGLSGDVLEAIEAHTFGKQGMGALAMVVYVADVIEPERAHDGVERLREHATHAALEDLFRDAYAASLKHLVKRRRPVHPETLAVWNSLVAGGAR